MSNNQKLVNSFLNNNPDADDLQAAKKIATEGGVLNINGVEIEFKPQLKMLIQASVVRTGPKTGVLCTVTDPMMGIPIGQGFTKNLNQGSKALTMALRNAVDKLQAVEDVLDGVPAENGDLIERSAAREAINNNAMFPPSLAAKYATPLNTTGIQGFIVALMDKVDRLERDLRLAQASTTDTFRASDIAASGAYGQSDVADEN